MTSTDLAPRFVAHLASLDLPAGPDLPVLVALSGGCDSVVLLHLLAFAAPAGRFRLSAAHLDHAIRPGSAADAAWTRGLCRAWDVPLHTSRLTEPPRSEDEARRSRYRFLREAAGRFGAEHIMTGHHADDQAETVLFRVLRGTGLRGLAGMRAVSGSGLVRPLLPFWREEIVRYARAERLRWREDETNADLRYARNRLRRQVIPDLEATVAPGARRNLMRLADLAAEANVLLERSTDRASDDVVRVEGERVLVARDAMRRYDRAISSRILRTAFRHFGIVPDRVGTRLALQFITDARSGAELHTAGGLRLRVEFDSAWLERPSDPLPDRELRIPSDRASGEASLRLGDRLYRARWHTGRAAPERPSEPHAAEEPGWTVALPLRGLEMPLSLRGWRPGDRMRTAAGTKKLKKLFLEHRVPRAARRTLPVLADASGAVLWVGGIAAGPVGTTAGENALWLSIDRADGAGTDTGEDGGA